MRVFFAADGMPPAVDVVRNRARAHRAETIELGDVFDADGGRHGGKELGVRKTELALAEGVSDKSGESRESRCTFNSENRGANKREPNDESLL